MEKYIGVKLINAELCLNTFGDEGYRITHEDGYISWHTKEEFEKTYKKIKDSIQGVVFDQPHKMRVLEEAQNLHDKIEKLSSFINVNPFFLNLEIEEQERLKQQLLAMMYYQTILIERIENFK